MVEVLPMKPRSKALRVTKARVPPKATSGGRGCGTAHSSCEGIKGARLAATSFSA